MVLMVEQHCGEHIIRRFVGRGNELDPRDVKIVSLKQQIQELEFPKLQQDSPTKEAKTESNVWDNGSEDVNPFGRGNLGFHDDHYDNPLLTKETESDLIIWDIGDEEEECPFVNKYPRFQEEPIVLVKDESCPVYEIDNKEEESMPVYDTDIEDVIKEEEGFVGKRRFGGEEDNIEDVVVVANHLCSSMIQTILSVDFEEDINTKSHELMSFGKSIIIKTHAEGSNLFMKKTDFEGLMKTCPYVFTLVVVEENEIINEAPLQVQLLLKEFDDVIHGDIPHGLHVMRDIQHCIDFILGFTIPNRPVYQMNLKEFAELQIQVTELMEKGSIFAPLTECMKGGRFTWTSEAAKAFDILKAKALKFINGKHKLKSHHAKWVEFIQDFLLVIRHKVGSNNQVADSIDRRHSLITTMQIRMQGFDSFHELYCDDPDFREMLFEWCRTCHIAKTHSSNEGFYTPLSVPVAPWEDVSLDFILGLPRTHQLARLYFEKVMKLHGVPKALTFDQDVKFVSHFWHTLWTHLGSKLQFSSSHHPQTNRSVNRTIGKSPFEVVYGRNPITPLDLFPIPEIIRHNEQYKKHADKPRKQVLYREGDLVWIHLRKEHFSTGRFGKLKLQGDGHFHVLKKINDNAYKIELPVHYNVSTPFNVADLSSYKGDSDDELDSGLSLFQEGEDDAYAVNERVNVINTLGAYFSAINFGGGLG
nr:hypothetical protein [Tanacetum cinerariifolium]